MTRGKRRAIVAGLMLAGWTFGQATLGVPQIGAAGTPVAVTPTVAGATSAATPTANPAARVATPTSVAAPAATTPAPVAHSSDASWTRFGLILVLGLALGGGAMMQYRATADAPPYTPKPRSRRRKPRVTSALAPKPAAVAAPEVAKTPVSAPAAPVFSAFPRQGQSFSPPPPQPFAQPLRAVDNAPRLTRAEASCAHAIAAAYRYDRPGTLAAFGAALDADPTLKPSTLPDFWEMPAGGHVDLALAYLQREQRLDARSVVTMALLTFPHNRELTALLREIDPYRLDRPA